MNRDAALAILRANESELRQRGVRHAALFGSVARDEAGPGSDLDVMIDIDRAAVRDVYTYVGLCQFIEELFPVEVDIADRESLKERIRHRAERDAITAF
jgi:predicted nucleotidyltransferase